MLKNDPRFYGILSDGGPRAYTVDTQRHREARGYGAFYGFSESQRGFPGDILGRPASEEQRIFGEAADLRLRAANYA